MRLSCLILLVVVDGLGLSCNKDSSSISGGAYPAWHPNSRSLLGVIGTSPTSAWTRFVRHWLEESVPDDTLSAVRGNDNRHPRYSPDSSRIAFSSQSVGNYNPDIWNMNADNSNIRQLTTEGTDEYFDWSPDGKYIVYTSYRAGDWTYANGTLWIVDVETGERRQLTFNGYP